MKSINPKNTLPNTSAGFVRWALAHSFPQVHAQRKRFFLNIQRRFWEHVRKHSCSCAEFGFNEGSAGYGLHWLAALPLQAEKELG